MGDDVERFKQELGRELERVAALGSPPRRTRPGARVVFVAVFVLLGMAGSALVLADRGGPAPIESAAGGGPLARAHVVDLAEVAADPVGAPERLRAELGLEVTIDVVPVAPPLVGTVSPGLEASPVPAQWERDGDGRLIRARLPRGYTGPLHLLVGRPAESGERYVRSVVDPRCPQFYGTRADDTLAEVLALAPTVSIELYGPEGYRDEVAVEELDDASVLILLEPLADDHVLVVYGANTSLVAPDPACLPPPGD